MSGINPGDYVRVGDSDLTWFVQAIHPNASAYGDLAHLRSGQTGRSRYEPVASLTLFRSAEFES